MGKKWSLIQEPHFTKHIWGNNKVTNKVTNKDNKVTNKVLNCMCELNLIGRLWMADTRLDTATNWTDTTAPARTRGLVDER